MDYETFTNSAFLLQGRADAFTVRTPAERKQVLGEILGLSLYDEYEQRAKDRVRETERQVAEVEGMLRDIDRDLARQPEYEAEQVQAEAEVARLSAAVKEAEAALQTLRREQQSARAATGAAARPRQAPGPEPSRSWPKPSRRSRPAGSALELYEQTLAERPQIEQGYADLTAARQAEAAGMSGWPGSSGCRTGSGTWSGRWTPPGASWTWSWAGCASGSASWNGGPGSCLPTSATWRRCAPA